MAGWDLKEGEINNQSDFKKGLKNFFIKKTKMQNLYKLSLMKSLIEVSKESKVESEVFYKLVISFSKNYFEYKKKLFINTTIYNGRSKKAELDIIISTLELLKYENFEIIDDEIKVKYILKSKELMKKNVLGALYSTLNELPYKFNKKDEEVYLNNSFRNFLMRNEAIINQLLEYRLIEFLKVSEKDKELLEKNLKEIELENIEIDYYKLIEKELELIY